MASAHSKQVLFFFIAVFAGSWIVRATNLNMVAEVRSLFGSENPPSTRISGVKLADFPDLIGQNVSMSVHEFIVGGVNRPHIHPRSTQLVLVTKGSLLVGFKKDNGNQYHNKTLDVGDMFVFPEGLAHFEFNADKHINATAISALATEREKLAIVPSALFNKGVQDKVLAQALKTDTESIQKIMTRLAAVNP